jgi:hypothetical protein
MKCLIEEIGILGRASLGFSVLLSLLDRPLLHQRLALLLVLPRGHSLVSHVDIVRALYGIEGTIE